MEALFEGKLLGRLWRVQIDIVPELLDEQVQAELLRTVIPILYRRRWLTGDLGAPVFRHFISGESLIKTG